MDKLTYKPVDSARNPGVKVAGVFAVATLNREDGQAAKAAGLWFHGQDCRPNCAACAAGLSKPQGWGRPAWWYALADSRGRVAAAKLAHHADDAATAAMGAAEANVAASRATDVSGDIEIPCPEGLSYYGYQKAGIAYALGRFGTLVGDEMGLGKSGQAIGVYAVEAQRNAAATMLVICPASLRINWARELIKWLTTPRSIHIVDGAKKLPVSLEVGMHAITIGADVAPGAQIVIVNYDRVRKTEVFEALMARDWTVIAADEAHFMKNPKSKRAGAVLGVPANRKTKAEAKPGLVSRAARLLALTGTPMPNKPVEMHPLLAALAPSEFGSWWTFTGRYCGRHTESVWTSNGQKDVTVVNGATNLDELQHRMRATCMVRRLKADVLKELPPKTRQLVILPVEDRATATAVRLENEAYAAREEILEQLEAEVNLAHASGDRAAYEAAAKSLQKATKVAFEEISAARRDTAVAKLPQAIEYIRGMLAEGVAKLSVWGHHVEGVLEALAKEFGDEAVMIHGGVSMMDRDAAVQRFQTDPTCRLFIGGITAAGVGLTLTAAHHAVFVELDWVPGNVSQAEDRHHRLTQLNAVSIYHLVLDGSLDQKMAATLISKQAIADRVLDLELKRVAIPAEPATRAPVPQIAANETKRLPSKRAAEDLLAEPVLPVGKHLRTERPAAYPVATEAQRDAALEAMQTLAGMCDGAVKRDDVGFSKVDAYAGKMLATRARSYTDGEVWYATVLARRYHRQLDGRLLTTLGLAHGAAA